VGGIGVDVDQLLQDFACELVGRRQAGQKHDERQ
jgi:hypothetical protein